MKLSEYTLVAAPSCVDDNRFWRSNTPDLEMVKELSSSLKSLEIAVELLIRKDDQDASSAEFSVGP